MKLSILPGRRRSDGWCKCLCKTGNNQLDSANDSV